MKKILVSLLAVAMAATMAVGFTGCGNSSSSSAAESSAAESVAESAAEEETTAAADDSAAATESMTGSFALAKIITADGTEQTLEEYCAANGAEVQGMQATYNFEDGGKVTAEIGGIGAEGTYTFDGTTLTTTFNGTEAAMTYDADASTLTAVDANSGITSVFVKQ